MKLPSPPCAVLLVTYFFVIFAALQPHAHCSLMLSLVTDDCPLKNRWLPGDSGESGCEVQTIALPVDTWAGSWLWNRCQFLGWPCSSTARRSRSTGGTGSGAEDAAYKSGYGGHSILNGDSCHGTYFDVLDRCRPVMCIWASLKDCNQTNISCLRNFSLGTLVYEFGSMTCNKQVS